MSSNPHTYHFELPSDQRPPYSALEEQVHPAFQWLTQHRARSRGRDIFEVIDTVVIHATAGYATEHVIDTWRSTKASAHWIIPDEDEPQHGNFVWAAVAEAKAAFHVGDVKYQPHIGPGTNVNNRSLGIEIVNTQNVQGYRDPYSDWQVEAAARIVLYAWGKYPKLKHVISHAKLDPARRADPGSNFPWAKFEELVLSHRVLPRVNPLIAARAPSRPPSAQPDNCCRP